MSVFASHSPVTTRPAIVLGLALLMFAAGLVIIFGTTGTGVQTASQLNVIATASPEPTGTTFPEPIQVDWDGYITRSLAGGQGIEVKSPLAQGGFFFAYYAPGFPESASWAPLEIHGRWLGTSCEYGRCAPEVEVESWNPTPIELQ